MKFSVKNLALSAMFLALTWLLPFVTMQIPQVGQLLSPMHIPVLLCGFICGWQYGLVVGLLAPVLRSLFFGMPPLFPTAFAMTFELAVYGAASGLLYAKLPKKTINVYISLILAMVAGRVAWGIVSYAIAISGGSVFTLNAFLQSTVIGSVPGIILHIVLIPLIVIFLQRASLMRQNA